MRISRQEKSDRKKKKEQNKTHKASDSKRKETAERYKRPMKMNVESPDKVEEKRDLNNMENAGRVKKDEQMGKL